MSPFMEFNSPEAKREWLLLNGFTEGNADDAQRFSGPSAVNSGDGPNLDHGIDWLGLNEEFSRRV
jgi:hypothetical protein